MGHTDIKTTTRYVHFYDESFSRAQQAITNFHNIIWRKVPHLLPHQDPPKPYETHKRVTILKNKVVKIPKQKPLKTLKFQCFQGFHNMERMTGIEPALPAWEAGVLPMNYIRRYSAFVL